MEYRTCLPLILLALALSVHAEPTAPNDRDPAWAAYLAGQEAAAAATRAYLDGHRPAKPKGVTVPIRGRVTDSSTGEPIALVTAFAFTLPNFDLVFEGLTDSNGDYEIQVPPGRYRVTFAAGDGEGNFLGQYTREQYSATREGFPVYCDFQNACFAGVDTPLDVGSGGIRNINATLDPASFIGGQLQDAAGTPLTGGFARRAEVTDTSGRFLNVAFQFGDRFGILLPPGQYVLTAATTSNLGYIDETHNGTPCPRRSCPVGAESPIVITGPGEELDDRIFTLDLGAIVTGAVINGVTMETVPAGADFYNANGLYAGFGPFGTDGYAARNGLPDGTYFVATVFLDSRNSNMQEFEGPGIFDFTGLRFVDGLFDGFPCPGGCDVTLGTPVTVSGGVVTDGPIDITVFPGGTIRGSVVAATDRAPIADVAIRFFDSEGVLVSRDASADDGSFAAGPFDPGDYFVVTDAEGTGFINQIFDGLDCGGTQCDIDAVNGTPITVPENGEVTAIVLRLKAEQVLTPADVEALDEAGRAIALCGNRLYVGVPGDDDAGPDAGAVNAFVREGRNYVFDEKIFADEPENGDMFGAALACDDESLAIGAPGAGPAAKGGGGSGRKPAAYVLPLGGDPSGIQALVATNLGGGGGNGADSFGASVAINGNTMVVGAPAAETGGAAVVFGGSSFTQQAILQDPEASPGDGFGTAVAASEGLVVAGAPNQALNGITSGLAQLFEEVGGGGYTNVGKFTNPGAAAGDSFGTAVAIEGTTLAVGAPGSDLAGQEDAGAAHVFAFDGQNVVQTAVLLAADPVASAGLGDAIALNGDLLIAGAPQATGSTAGTGAAYLFQQDGADWNQVDKFSSESSDSGDAFGSAVGFDGDQVAVGSPSAGDDTGLATVFSNAETVFGTGFE
ncbi:MAG: carboxypeptidase regulatory-like domain-containing protein [Pseudomonadota bacterium]